MEPFPGAVVHDTHQSSPGEVSRGIVVVEIPDNTGNDCANASFGAQDNTGALSPRDIEMAGAKEEKTTDEVNVHTLGTPAGSAAEEFADVTIDFVELTSKSPKVAHTLYRSDEAAYRVACGRTHALLVKKRKRPLRQSLSPDCLAMMQFGRGMKVQRRGILQRLEEEETRQEYIKYELSIAIEKTESRARRAEAASVAWNKWCLAKNIPLTPLDAVLANPSGRYIWREYLQKEIRREPTTPPPAGRHSGRSKDNQSLRVNISPSSGPMEELLNDHASPTEEATTALPSSQRQPAADPPTASSKGEDAGGQLLVASGIESTTLKEASLSEDASELQIVASDQGERKEMKDSPATVALLHLALENVTRHGGKEKAHELDIAECAQFCTEWPRDCLLPTFFDRALLQPAWSAAEQGSSGEGVSIDVLYPAREALRHEVQRLFFAGFLGSSEGQGFVIHAIQDGTFAPEEVQIYLQDLTEGACFDEDAQGFRRIIAHGDEWMNSRLIHQGVEQRVRVEAAEPVLQVVLEECTRHISDHRGKLAAIVQYVYSLAASRLQPFLRGALARRRLPDVHWEVLSYAIEIQRICRGYLLRSVVQKVLREKTRAQNTDLHGWASLVIQRQARVWLARRIVGLKKVEIGLSSRVSKLADRLASSDDSRSVSAVFGQIDKDYRNYERVIGEMQAREEEMAVTFVEKVLERRDADIEGVWTRFVGAATEHCAALKCRSDALRAHPQPISHDKRAGASAIHDQKLLRLMGRYGIQANARTLPSAYLRAALPMHLKLRSGGITPSITVKSATQTKKRQRTNNNVLPTSEERVPAQRQVGGAIASQVQSSISSGYANASFEDVILSISSATAATMSTPPGGGGGGGGAFANSPSHIGGAETSRSEGYSRKRQTAAGGDIGIGGFGGGGGVKEAAGSETSHLSASRHAWSSAAGSPERFMVGSRLDDERNGSAAGWESMWDTERESRGLTGDAGSRFPGSSVRQDMPSGLKEGVERLCAAAFLRGHVPEGLMPKDTAPEEAYQRYLELPPSLAKIRHEQLCIQASRPVASLLRARGYTTLEQLLPPSKLQHLFSEVGAGVDETLAAVSLAREIKPKTGNGGDDGPCHDLFSPLSPFARRGLAGSRRSPNSKERPRGSRGRGGTVGGVSDERGRRGESRGTSRGTSRGSGRPWTGGEGGPSETRRTKGPPRISINGLGFEGGTRGTGKGDERWDPSRYTSRPEEWIRPPPSVIKRRWDLNAKAFVPVNNYSFDGLYRRHHPLDPRYENEDPSHYLDDGRNIVSSGSGDDMSHYQGERHHGVGQGRGSSSQICSPAPVAAPLSGPAGGGGDKYARRMEDVLREEYGTFFDGMTQSARDLYQHMINDSTSWGTVEGPISTFLCRAAFYVVGHPSPATKAELAEAREKDLLAKGFRGKKNNLARPIALAGKFKPSGREREVADAALAGEQVPMGLEAFREFIRQLDATSAGRAPSPTPKTSLAGRPYGLSSVVHCRTLLERRLEAAATLADPFRIRLEADGILNVKMLARVAVRAWGLPPLLVEEIERMLGLLVARTCASDHYHAHGRQRKIKRQGPVAPSTAGSTDGGGKIRCQDKKAGGASKRQHLVDFDPRFQRSATDPFGRPPRLDRIQPCLDPRQQRRNARGNQTLEDENDLPPGMWDRPAASEGPTGSNGPGDNEEESTVEGATKSVRSLLSFSPPDGGTLLEDTKCTLHTAEAERVPEKSPQEPVDKRKLQHKPRQWQQPQPHQVATEYKSIGGEGRFSNPTSGRTPGSSSRFTCREQPRCKAVFANASTLRTHERSHAAAPGYHCFRRAAQLLRDPPPASSEGAGAPAEKFRLRTTLPPSVRRELQSLHDENVVRRRQSLLAGPGLSGTVATWAGVVSPGRTVGGTV